MGGVKNLHNIGYFYKNFDIEIEKRVHFNLVSAVLVGHPIGVPVYNKKKS
jgi:hypothetical protein